MKDECLSLPADMTGIHVHFVGIKGTGMAALVEILCRRNATITGSDVAEVFYTDQILKKCGITPFLFNESNITDDISLIIYSSAYNEEKNVELALAKKKGIPCILYSKALGLVSESAYSCGICGVHGKTTTTGLAGTILKELELPAQVLAGSIISSFGTCTYSSPKGSKYFVAETCEYQRHFMDFCPQKIILTSVESDHQDYYPTFKDIQNAFIDYACKLPEGGQLIYCADDKGACQTAFLIKERRNDIELIPYGQNADGPYKITFGPVKDGIQYFSVKALGEFELHIPGRHLVLNATAALALCTELLKLENKNAESYLNKMQNAIKVFSGGKRRSEIIGRCKTKNGKSLICIDDYGHHPTAIKTTLAGYRDFYKNRRMIVDFMSHTYSRTESLLEEFASSFSDADTVVLNKIYASAREDASSAKVNGKILAERTSFYHKDVHYCKEFDEAKDFILKELEKPLPEDSDGFLLVTMGAGDNWKVGKEVLNALV